MRILQEDKLGACRIENVKLSDAKEWALRMKEKGYGFKTINNHKRSLKAAFYTAIQDDCIRKNPFDFQLNTVLEDDTEPKEPLSPTQEAAFLSFVQHDKVYQKYYDEIIILLGTGLRISELCGLTEADIDLDKQLINVDHQLLKIADVGYYVETPKTKSGNRVIPMSEKVLEAFQRVLNKRKYAQPVIFLSRERISPLSAAPHGAGKSRSLFGLLPLRAMRGKREDFSFEKPSLFTYFLLCRSNYSASCIAFAAATAFACASAEHCS